MGTEHTVADDLVYDLVSVQYHALKAAQAYDRYASDAEGHDDVKQFFQQCAQQDAERAQRCHDLLRDVTGGGQGLSAGS